MLRKLLTFFRANKNIPEVVINKTPGERWKYEILANLDFNHYEFVVTHAQKQLSDLLSKTVGSEVTPEMKEKYKTMQDFLLFNQFDVNKYMAIVEKIQSDKRLKYVFSESISSGSRDLIEKRDAFRGKVDLCMQYIQTTEVYKRDSEKKVGDVIQNICEILRAYNQHVFLEKYKLTPVYEDRYYKVAVCEKESNNTVSFMAFSSIYGIFNSLDQVALGQKNIYSYDYTHPKKLVDRIIESSSAEKSGDCTKCINIATFSIGGDFQSNKKIYVTEEHASILLLIGKVTYQPGPSPNYGIVMHFSD